MKKPSLNTFVLATTAVLVVVACGSSTPSGLLGGGGPVIPPPNPPPVSGPSRCGEHPWCDVRLSPDERTALLLAELTQAEKISLLGGDNLSGVAGAEGTHTGTGNGIPRVDLPTIYYSDGPMGVRSGMGTALPAPMGLAATWDVALARRYGAMIGDEARNKGNDVVFAPTVDLMRVPMAGRSFEGYGEDPYLSSRMGVAWITGAQSEGVVANAKHYAPNSQEGIGAQPPPELPGVPLGGGVVGGRVSVDARVDDRTLHEIYLAPFEAAVKEAKVGSIMCAYNRLNGQYACENRYLLTDVLRGEWGFKGYVLADYAAAKNPVDSLNNGLDFDPWPGVVLNSNVVTAAVTAGLVSAATLDERVGNMLRTWFAYGVLDRPAYVYDNAQIDQEGHARFAGEVEESALTLLQNDGVLPLDVTKLKTVAIIGVDADKFQKRGGSAGITPFFFNTPREKLTERLTAAGVEVRYDDGSMSSAAVTAATGADVALVFVSDYSIEGSDRPCLSLNCLGDVRDQDALIEAIAAANPNTVVVLETGAPVLTPWRGAVRAILEAWIPGVDAGNAITRVLFGDVDPGGRLPATFPNSEADLPTAGDPMRYPGVGERAEYSEGVLIGYRWFDAMEKTPAFAFGHGLSYTTFDYRNLRVTKSGDTATVRFEVRNSGSRRGREVAQLYLSLPAPSADVPQPPKVLKAFEKLTLAPGESREVTLTLDARAFSYWDVASKSWRITPGCYPVMVGRSSRDLRLTDATTLCR